MCFPKNMLSMFITNPEIVAQGTSSLRLLFSTYITLGFMIISITFFQALGKGSTAAMLTVSRQILIFVPLVLILPKIGGLGIQGVWIAPVITDIIVLILSTIVVLKAFKNMNKLKNIKTSK